MKKNLVLEFLSQLFIKCVTDNSSEYPFSFFIADNKQTCSGASDSRVDLAQHGYLKICISAVYSFGTERTKITEQNSFELV